MAPQVSAICGSFPTLFPNQIRERDTIENCGVLAAETDNDFICDVCDDVLGERDDDDRDHRRDRDRRRR